MSIIDTAQIESTEQVQTAEEPAAVNFTEKPAYDFFKRVFDVVSSALALVVLSPLFLITSIVIVADDFGSPFFVQERTGKNGKVFRMYKFRTMYKDAEQRKAELADRNEADGIHFKIKDDPRILRHAKFIRKSSIDELPQLLNVIKGDMSVVGPRPFVVNEQEQLPDERLVVKPGLSCYWQLSDREEMPIEEQLDLDYKYINERSFGTDIKIILKTFMLILRMGND